VSAKPLTSGQKLVYLDWSTFVDAFQGLEQASSDAHRNLNRLVFRLAADTNLCFSLTHLWELLHQEDAQKRHDVAHWLDGMNLVWIHSDNEVIRSEIIHAVLDAVRGTSTAPPIPTAPSFLSIFHEVLADSKALTYGLGHSRLIDFVDLTASNPDFMKRLGGFRKLSVESARRLYDDRVQGLKVVDKPSMLAELDRKLRANLEVDALQAAELLRGDPGSGFHVLRNGIFVSPTNQEVLAALSGFPDLAALPFVFLFHRAVRNMSFEITRRPSKQSRAFDQQRGDVYDHAHLVGAAYCDVFTCDKKMVKRLDGGREALGRKAPISAAGGIAALIKGIEGQLVS